MKTPFKLKSGNTTPFKEMGSSPAKGLRKDQVVDGQLCDAYGNPKPSNEQIKAGLQSPNFSNKNKKVDRGLGPGFDRNKKKEETIKKESDALSGKDVEAEEKAAKQAKKDEDMSIMESSIDMTLGK